MNCYNIIIFTIFFFNLVYSKIPNANKYGKCGENWSRTASTFIDKYYPILDELSLSELPLPGYR